MAEQSKSDLLPNTCVVDQRQQQCNAHQGMLQSLSQLRSEIQGNQQQLEDNFLQRAGRQMREKFDVAYKLLKKAFGAEATVCGGVEYHRKFARISDFTECCNAISKELRKINQTHNQKLVDLEDLRETEQQLLKKEVLLSFYGQYNSGKSTLINAILHSTLLPVNWDAETSFRLKIQRTCDSECFLQGKELLDHELDGVSKDEDKKKNCLKDVDCNLVIANGASDIFKTLKDVNKTVRDRKNSKPPNFLLKVNTPLTLEVPDGWQLSLVDNPGYDEYTPHISDAANQSLKVSAACLYVTTPTYYKRRETALFFKKMYSENKEIFTQRRLIVVLTKLDEATGSRGYHNDYNVDSVDVINVAKSVSEHIQNVCGLKEFPKDIVIPVYGKWADYARCLAKDPLCSDLRYEVESILMRHMCPPAGQGEHPRSFFQRKDPTWLVKEVEKLSNICKLESRLQEVAKSCVKVWEQKMHSDYLGYLAGTKGKLEQKSEALEVRMRDKEKMDLSSRIHTLEQVHTVYMDIKNSIQCTPHDPLILKSFEEAYDKDSKDFNPLSIVEEKVRELMKAVKEKAILKLRTNAYGPEDFMKDIRKIVKKSSASINEVLNESSCFHRLLQCRTHHLTNKVTLNLSRICSLLEKLDPSFKGIKVDSQEAMEDAPILKVPKFAQAAASINPPDISGGLLEKIVTFFKRFFSNRESESLESDEEESSGIQSAIHDDSAVDGATNGIKANDSNVTREADSKDATSSSKNKSQKKSKNNRSTDVYWRWTSEMDTNLAVLLEKIENENKLYFDHFKDQVTKAYWRSYCELATKYLKDFNQKYDDQLEQQTALLCKDIAELLQENEQLEAIIYDISLINYMIAQFRTISGRLCAPDTMN